MSLHYVRHQLKATACCPRWGVGGRRNCMRSTGATSTDRPFEGWRYRME